MHVQGRILSSHSGDPLDVDWLSHIVAVRLTCKETGTLFSKVGVLPAGDNNPFWFIINPISLIILTILMGVQGYLIVGGFFFF